MVNLCLDNLSKWFEVICQNNSTEAKALLEEVTTEKRNIMLNCDFDFGEVDNSTRDWSYTTRKPLFLAAIFGSLDILKLFSFYNVDFCQVDEDQNNVVHSLISMCLSEPKYETRYTEVYKLIVMDLVTFDDRKRLLLSENKDGLRPVELAAHYSCLRFFTAIVETPGVHMSHIEQKGIQQHAWVDVTEYESFGKGCRRDRSPLKFLSLVDKRIFQDEEASQIFTTCMVKKWVRYKLLINSPILLLWTLFRFVHVTAFYIVVTVGKGESPRIETLNNTIITLINNITTTSFNASQISMKTGCNTYIYFSYDSVEYWIAVVVVQICSYIVLLFDVIEFCVNRCKKTHRWRRTPKGRKKCFVNETFYRSVYNRNRFYHTQHKLKITRFMTGGTENI